MGSVSPGDAREGALERAAEPYDDVGCSETTTWYGSQCRRRLACCMHELSCGYCVLCCSRNRVVARGSVLAVVPAHGWSLEPHQVHATAEAPIEDEVVMYVVAVVPSNRHLAS